MRRILIIAALAASTAAAVPAFAQEKDPFTGPRVEANVGYDDVTYDHNIAGLPHHNDGVRVGGAVGYDVALGKTFTIGAEAGVGFDLGGSQHVTVGTDRLRLSNGRDIDLSLRVGARVAPHTLIYAKAGYANSRETARLTNAAGTVVTRDSTDLEGLRVGAGVEQALSDHLYVKGEYRYTSYGHDTNRHQALVGFGYRF